MLAHVKFFLFKTGVCIRVELARYALVVPLYLDPHATSYLTPTPSNCRHDLSPTLHLVATTLDDMSLSVSLVVSSSVWWRERERESRRGV